MVRYIIVGNQRSGTDYYINNRENLERMVGQHKKTKNNIFKKAVKRLTGN